MVIELITDRVLVCQTEGCRFKGKRRYPARVRVAEGLYLEGMPLVCECGMAPRMEPAGE